MTKARTLADFIGSDNDVKFDTNTLYVDSSTDRVGIGTSTPSTPLHVIGNNGILVDTEGNGDGQIYFGGISGSDRSYLSRSSNDFAMWNVSNGTIKFATNDTERMRIDSSGNLLLGGTTFDTGNFSSSANGINVFDATVPIVNLVETTGNTSFYMAKGPTYAYIGTADAHFIGFSTSDTERMRIDSSGNLFVGKTSANLSLTGIQATSSGQAFSVTRDGGAPFNLNRLTSDGEIAGFWKDTVKVGKIGNVTATPFFSNATTGGIRLGTSSGSTIVNPCSDTGATENNLHDLGSSAAAWRNLYLGGGVYIGGTAAANKLDDYEEGTWTPVLKGGSTTVTTSNEAGTYIKSGDLVMLHGRVKRNDSASVSGEMQIANLPFPRHTVTYLVPVAAGWMWMDNATGNDKLGFPYFNATNACLFTMDSRVDTSNRYMQISQFTNGRSLYFCMSYRTG